MFSTADIQRPINKLDREDNSTATSSNSKKSSSDENKYPSKLLHSFKCEQGAIRAVRFNFDGNYCLTCGSDKSIKLWNPKNNLLIKKYGGHGYDVMDVVGSNDNCQLASCSADKSVMYWDVASGQIIRRFRGHAAQVNCVNFNEESTVILSGSVDSSVRVWDCRSRKSIPIQVMDEAKDSVTSIQVNDHEILTSSIDGNLRRYDIRMGSLILDNIGVPVTCVKFTKDSQCTLSSAHDNTLRLLDVETGELLGEYTGHKNNKYNMECALNSKDDHVLSGSEDGIIYIWDLISAEVKTKMLVKSHRPVNSLAVHFETDLLLASCDDEVFVFAPQDYELPS